MFRNILNKMMFPAGRPNGLAAVCTGTGVGVANTMTLGEQLRHLWMAGIQSAENRRDREIWGDRQSGLDPLWWNREFRSYLV